MRPYLYYYIVVLAVAERAKAVTVASSSVPANGTILKVLQEEDADTLPFPTLAVMGDAGEKG